VIQSNSRRLFNNSKCQIYAAQVEYTKLEGADDKFDGACLLP
jgi:hypothetical protein